MPAHRPVSSRSMAASDRSKASARWSGRHSGARPYDPGTTESPRRTRRLSEAAQSVEARTKVASIVRVRPGFYYNR